MEHVFDPVARKRPVQRRPRRHPPAEMGIHTVRPHHLPGGNHGLALRCQSVIESSMNTSRTGNGPLLAFYLGGAAASSRPARSAVRHGMAPDVGSLWPGSSGMAAQAAARQRAHSAKWRIVNSPDAG